MYGNYSREETIQGLKLYEEIRYFFMYETISTFAPPLWTHIISELVGVDGLAIIKVKESGRTAERVIEPRLNEVFNSEDLKITIESATQVTDYLDVKFNLEKHVHEPYRKPNDHPYGNTGCGVFKEGIQN